MGCGCNKEKPKGGGKSFTKAVVEIVNPEKITLLRKVVIPASLGDETTIPPAVGLYRNVVLYYEASKRVYLYSSDGIPTFISTDLDAIEDELERLGVAIEDETSAREQADEELGNSISDLSDALDEEIRARISGDDQINNTVSAHTLQISELSTGLNNEIDNRRNADTNLQSQIDAISAASDVKDIVGTHAELENYDTTSLGDNDIIKVLQDETQDDATAYYRWDTSTQEFTLIGEEGPYYTKSQTDDLLTDKQNVLTAGNNITITGDTISATDTTYSAGNGLSLSGTTFSADTTVLQPKLTAGDNISITNNTISATDTTYTAGSGLDLTGTEFSIDNTVALKTDLPTVNNAVFTVQKNGVDVASFTANSAVDATANITVPTDTAQLTNTAGYQTASDVASAISGKQDTLTPGNNIQINGNTISATNTTYSAGNGLDLTGTVFSADTSVLQTKLTAGDNISISNGVISSTGPTYSAGTGLELTNNVFAIDDSVVALKSDIPVISSATLIIQRNGTDVATFTTDAANPVTANILVPTNNAQLINGAGYQTASDVQGLISGKQDILTPGTNIQINGNTISATDTKYSAGTGLNLTGTVFSADTTVLATQSDLSGKQDTLTPGSNITITNNTISATDTTYSDFDGADASTAGTSGLVPAPIAGDQNKFLRGDGTWANDNTELVEMAYGESNAWAKFIAAYTDKKIVYCRASSNSNPGSGAKTRKAFMAYVNDETAPTSVEFQYVRSVNSKSNSQQCDQVFVYTLTSTNGGTWSVATRNMATTVNVDSSLTKTYTGGANATMTLKAKAMTGATSSVAGTAGYVPAPAAGDNTKYLSGDGTWKTVSQYALPIATANDLGGIKVGANLSIDPSTGVLSADAQQVTLYSSTGQNTDGAMTQKATTDALGLKADTSSLATVATSGSYTDLTNKPSIPAAQVNSDWNSTSGVSEILNKPTLATVATSGSYNDLTNKPSIPAAQVQSDWTQSDNTKVDYIKNKPSLATVATSGSYNDLSNKPTIPTVNNATLTIQKNGTSVGTFTANASSNKTINITVPTTAADVSALPASTKYGASIAVSINTTDYKVTTTLKDQDGNTLGTAQVIDLPLESVVVNGSYDSTNKKIVLTLQSGSTIDIPVGDLVAGLQSEITSTNKLSSDLVDDTNHTHKFVTAAQITKLNGIAAGAEVNVQSDWDQTTTTADDYIKNKPSIPTKTSDLTNDSNFVSDANYVHTDNNYTTTEKNKLSGIAAGAEVNVQANWAQTTTTADDYIKNKPTLATVATSGSYNDLSNKPTIPAAQVNSDWDATSGVAQILNKPTLATVATSGSYNDLSNKPTIPTVNNATLTIQKNGTTVKTFTANASSNVTANITVPTKTSDITNDSNFVASGDLATVATSGSYNDLSNKPTIPAAQVQSNWTQTNTTSKDYIKNKPSLATVATSGSYNDLTNKPTIPTVNNATLTIQKNGTNVQTFTANQSTNATANITVPTKTSDLTNDSGFITSSGTVSKADQLTNARTIGIGTGATGTATSFDGTSNITIPVTDVKDAYVTWGGKAIYDNISPDDAGCVDEFGHNKMAFLPANCIQVHYSTDGGSTWVDYGLTDAQKIQLVTYGDVTCKSGKDTAATSSNVTNLKLRVRIATAVSTATGNSSLYTMWKKILINVNDPGSNAQMTFRYRTIANYKAGTETWVNSGTTYNVRGGSGWNSIPIPTSWPDRFGGHYTNQTGQPGQIEFVFSNTKLGTWGDKKVSVASFRMIGATNWQMPSETARTGRLYTIDSSQNATFPKSIYSGSDVYAYNLYNRDTGSTYGNIGSSSTPWKSLYLSDGLYNGTVHLNLPSNTGTLALTSDAQKFAIGQGSNNPVFDDMTPIRTFEWDVSDANYRPIYTIANTGLTYINLDVTVAYRITITGTNINGVVDVVDRWHNPASYPITSMFCRTLSTAAATTGLRYLRAVYPTSSYVNNASYPLGQEIAMYNTTARHVKVEVFKDNSQVTWNTTKPSGSIYVNSTYNGNSVMNAYDTRGWRFRQPVQMQASGASYASYISDYEPVTVGVNDLKSSGTALAAGHMAFLAEDGKVYDISNTTQSIAMGPSKIGYMNSNVNANTVISSTYWRAITRLGATQFGYFRHDTVALGDRLFLRCTMDSNGKIHSNNYLAKSMSAGYTWMPFGYARSATTAYVDTRYPIFYTINSNGKLTHINGIQVAGSSTIASYSSGTLYLANPT